MASSVNAALAAMAAAALWMLLGYALGRRIFPRALAIGAAPITGWAVYNAFTVPLFGLIGFTPIAVAGTAILCSVASCFSIFALTDNSGTETTPSIPAWFFIGAAIIALIPAAAILPKTGTESVQLADAIFDHSKIAIIDAMTRLGLPPVNPFFGDGGEPGRLAYYYLWYFSAAQLSLALGVSGWEADVGQTWFSAFASLSLMTGVAVWLSKRSIAALGVLLFACATSLRTMLVLIFGADRVASFLSSPTGFAGWLFQAAWVPQHLTSATCVVLAMLLLSQYAARQTNALLAMFVLVVVAGFESSTYVGGVTFAIAALFAGPILLAQAEKHARFRFVGGLFAAATLSAILAAPFLFDQIATVAPRGTGTPIVVHHVEVLSESIPLSLRRLLDWPAYWLVLLPIELPATFIAGVISLAVMFRVVGSKPEKFALIAFVSLAAAGLLISWLLVSTLGENNDLGWRSVLPAAMVLIAAAAVGMSLQPRRTMIAVAVVGGLMLSLPDVGAMIYHNFIGNRTPESRLFAQSPEMWAAVRRHAAPNARVGNNPLYLKDMTLWPVDISWALLADRSSCFAGRELAIAYVPLTRERRETIHAQFVRVFEGQGTSQDILELATRYGCDVVLVTPQDGAWTADPFASDANYRLAETRDGRWRIYKRAPGN
jgi:hypothetical protein